MIRIKKIFFQNILLLLLLILLINNTPLITKASSDDFNIPEEYITQMDDILKTYIDENIPKKSSWIDSNTETNLYHISSSPKVDELKIIDKNKVDSKIYTFANEENGELIFYTIVDFYFIEKINMHKSDLLEVKVNNFIRPFSPARAILLLKNEVDTEWEMKDDIKAIVNGSIISVYGDQIYNNKDLSRIIISFSSLENVNSVEKNSNYIVNYTNQSEYRLSIIFYVIVISLIFILMILFARKYKAGTAD